MRSFTSIWFVFFLFYFSFKLLVIRVGQFCFVTPQDKCAARSKVNNSSGLGAGTWKLEKQKHGATQNHVTNNRVVLVRIQLLYRRTKKWFVGEGLNGNGVVTAMKGCKAGARFWFLAPRKKQKKNEYPGSDDSTCYDEWYHGKDFKIFGSNDQNPNRE